MVSSSHVTTGLFLCVFCLVFCNCMSAVSTIGFQRQCQEQTASHNAYVRRSPKDECRRSKFPPKKRSGGVAVLLASSPRAQARACDWHWRLPGPGHTARFFSFKVLGMFLVLEAKNFSHVTFTFSSVVTDSRE